MFRVQDLELGRISFDVSFQPGKLDPLDDAVRQVGVLHAAGWAELRGGSEEIRVSGHLEGVMESDCSRCLEPARCAFDGDFSLDYLPVDQSPHAAATGFAEKESDIGYYEGEVLDLADVLREQVLLWLPMQWVCRQDCRGICPVCGGNRNEEWCECQEGTGDPRWAALRESKNKGTS